jgi:hypothetical protein
MKKLLLILLICVGSYPAFAQELNAQVNIQAPTVSNMDQRNLDRLQQAIRSFLNDNKWTDETYLQQERIKCNFVITISAWDGASGYKAEAQIQSSRPVFGTAYSSTLLNLSDKEFDFNYTVGQALDFSEQNFISNLSSLLGFYAYTITGMDKDSFSKFSGTPYFTKARNTLNIAQTAGNVGWKANDGLRNRYWLNENLLNNNFSPLRAFSYSYHRGLDHLQADLPGAGQLMQAALNDLNKTERQQYGSYLPNVFFGTKAEEIVQIFSSFDAPLRTKAYQLMKDIDPGNVSKYDALNLPH